MRRHTDHGDATIRRFVSITLRKHSITKIYFLQRALFGASETCHTCTTIRHSDAERMNQQQSCLTQRSRYDCRPRPMRSLIFIQSSDKHSPTHTHANGRSVSFSDVWRCRQISEFERRSWSSTLQLANWRAGHACGSMLSLKCRNGIPRFCPIHAYAYARSTPSPHTVRSDCGGECVVHVCGTHNPIGVPARRAAAVTCTAEPRSARCVLIRFGRWYLLHSRAVAMRG